MKSAAVRLVAQGLVTRPYATPTEAVAAFGAMQGQDLLGAISSVALRTSTGDPAEVLAAMDEGTIVRGYPMRGTVFLVAADDLAWMTELMAAPALRASERRRPQLGLTNDHLRRAAELAASALRAPRGLSRAELFAVWDAGGVPTPGGRGYHLLSALIHEGLACYGPWNGADQNIVLASSWLPAGSDLQGRFNGDRVAAVTELLRRYLTSHGPATLRDFAWWTKLTLTEIRAAAPQATAGLDQWVADEPAWCRGRLADEVAALGRAVDAPLLLPGFDEFILGYPDRLFAMTQAQLDQLVPGGNGVFRRAAIVGGKVVGFWKRGGRPGKRVLDLEELARISATNRARLERAFGQFPFHDDAKP